MLLRMAFVASLALSAAACDLSQLAFVQDNRIEIIEPEDRSQVSLPLTISWKVEEFDVTGPDGDRDNDAGYFAIFIDRPPMSPGKTLEWLAQQEASCGSSACGTPDRLANVYTTVDTSVEIDRLPSKVRSGPIERHEAVVVLLDGAGARIGESAFYVRFEYNRSGQS